MQETVPLPSTGLVLVDFWAEWCQPCKQLLPKLQELEPDYPQITFVKVNAEENPELANSMQVRGLPFLALLKDGQPLGSLTGNVGVNQIRDFLDTNLEYAT